MCFLAIQGIVSVHRLDRISVVEEQHNTLAKAHTPRIHDHAKGISFKFQSGRRLIPLV